MVLTTLACALPARITDVESEAAQVEDEVPALSIEPTASVEAALVESCPVEAGVPEIPDLQSPNEIAADIQMFLNQGGGTEDLKIHLRSNEFLSEEPADFSIIDLNADLIEDLAVSLLDPESVEIIPTGRLFIFLCREDSYQLSYSTPDLPGWSGPGISAAEDLTFDGTGDLLLTRFSCGAHTCFANVELISWDDPNFVNRWEGISEDLPSPQIEIRHDPLEVVITATGINSAGAGPFRPIERHWSWNAEEQTYQVSEENLLPSNFRFHVLLEADQAFVAGAMQQALALYDRVEQGAGLDDWANPELERANLGAYALFRKTLIYLREGNISAGQDTYNRLINAYPPESEQPGSSYAAMAIAFWDEFGRTSNIDQACDVAVAFAITHTTEILDPLYFGYANPAYNASDLCPQSTQAN
jgi:hypothetical protein